MCIGNGWRPHLFYQRGSDIIDEMNNNEGLALEIETIITHGKSSCKRNNENEDQRRKNTT